MSAHHDRMYASGGWARARRAALDRDGWRCVECGHPGALEVHHVVPLDQGGAPLDLANLQTLCRGCHIGAHMDPARREWRRFLREIA